MTCDNYLLSKQPEYDETQIHALNKDIAYVLVSGGVDSLTALWWALENYRQVKIYIVDYNQPHKNELDAAEYFMKLMKLEFERVKIDIPIHFWGIENRLTRGQACLMTSLLALDISHKGADIIHGILRTDNYGDCDRNFLDVFADVLSHPDDTGKIGIVTPLRAFQKKSDVIAYAYELGVPIIDTWTCRNPVNGAPCEQCAQCRLRNEAFEEFYAEYKVEESAVKEWMNIYGSPYHPKINSLDNKEVNEIISFFLNNNGVKRGTPVMVYKAPDDTYRVSTHIHYIPRKLKKIAKLKNFFSIYGTLEDGYRWELCISKDGEIASTERLPAIDVLTKNMIQNIEA